MKSGDIFWIELGCNLAALREDRKITQDTLAKALGLSRTSVTNIEKGRQAISVLTLVQICQILSCKTQDIIPNTNKFLADKTLDKISSFDNKTQQWVKGIIEK